MAFLRKEKPPKSSSVASASATTKAIPVSFSATPFVFPPASVEALTSQNDPAKIGNRTNTRASDSINLWMSDEEINKLAKARNSRTGHTLWSIWLSKNETKGTQTAGIMRSCRVSRTVSPLEGSFGFTVTSSRAVEVKVWAAPSMPVLPEQRVTSRQTSKYKRFPSQKARKTERSGARSKSLATLRSLEGVVATLVPRWCVAIVGGLRKYGETEDDFHFAGGNSPLDNRR